MQITTQKVEMLIAEAQANRAKYIIELEKLDTVIQALRMLVRVAPDDVEPNRTYADPNRYDGK